jgi:hypothetical protein
MFKEDIKESGVRIERLLPDGRLGMIASAPYSLINVSDAAS